MDLRAITNLDGGRLQSQAASATPTVGNAAAPLAWDPGVRHPNRQRRTNSVVALALPPLSPSPPVPSSTAGDACTQHKHYRPPELFRASFSEGGDTDVDEGDGEEGTDDEYDEYEVADGRPGFVPDPYPRSAREVAPRFSGPHNLRAHPLGVNTTRISAQSINRVNSDRSGTRANTATTHMARRRGRSEDDDSEEQGEDGEDIQSAEERLRYRPRRRRRCSSSGSERGISLKLSLPDPAPKPTPRRGPLSPQFPQSPLPNSLSLHLPTIPNPRRHPAASDETTQQQSQSTRLERHSPLVPPKPIKVRSPSVESITEWPEAPAPRSVQKKTVSPGSSQATASASAPTHDTSGAVLLSDSEMADETEHLRAQLGCPPGAPVGLRALADPPPGEKPNYPLPTLIKLAIYDSPRGRLTLQEIYQALEDRFEWFRQRTDELSWKNSIRHNLSLRKCFLKVQRPITEPGKGSYWMIDLTQGEGNKRVRKRNKKPTKSQLAAQAYRLPGQGGDPLRPPPYPQPSHAPPQPISKEETQAMDCDDDYLPQAPPMQTNFTTKPTELPQPQPQHPRTLLPPRGAATIPSNSSLRAREPPDLDANIDPALRVPDAAPTSRSSKVPHLSHLPPSSPVAKSQHMLLPRPPHHSSYPHPFLPHQQSQAQGAVQQRSQTTASPSHIPHARVPMSSLPHDQMNTQRQQSQQLPQQQAAQPPARTPAAQAQTRTPRLPPMRTLSQSPDPTSSEPSHTSPPPTSPPPSTSGPPTSPPRPTTGFERFARAPTRFAPTLPFSDSPQQTSPATPIRPLATYIPPSSSSSSSSSVGTAPAPAEGEGGSKRRFVPPPPRAGIEYVQREGGGLVTARRPSGRYGEYTIDWLGRFVKVNANGGG